MMIITQSSCSKGGNGPVTREEFMLDTICSVSVYEMTDGDAENAIDEAFALCDELEHKLSRTIADSDISRINSSSGDWTEVSPETIELIQKGIDYSKLSGGAFDITCGAITELWDFHAAEVEEKLPDEKSLAEAASHIGYKCIEIDGARVRLTDTAAKLDLGGIAKGYIGDKMTELLEAKGVTSGIINLGGNVICIEKKSENEDFVIGVEAPFSDRREIIGKINARDMTLVTSGVYERKMEIGGRIYHHILNTKTGWPADTDLDAVTLIAEKGHSADIDALSTICLIKGYEEARALIEDTPGIEAVYVLKDGDIQSTNGAKLNPAK